jgi:hypothetical protein
MEEESSSESALTMPDISDDGIVCPFSGGRWKKVGDALVFFMLFVVPILYLVVFLITR